MKILFVLFIAVLCFASGPSTAAEYTTKISSRVTLNLSLLPQETNLPTFDIGKPIDGPKPGFELMIQTLSGGRSISNDTSAPVFIRVNPHGASIRFEWKFD